MVIFQMSLLVGLGGSSCLVVLFWLHFQRSCQDTTYLSASRHFPFVLSQPFCVWIITVWCLPGTVLVCRLTSIPVPEYYFYLAGEGSQKIWVLWRSCTTLFSACPQDIWLFCRRRDVDWLQFTLSSIQVSSMGVVFDVRVFCLNAS